MKVPVTLTPDLAVRLEAFVGTVARCVSPPAASALNRSAVCRVAIEELLERYEARPDRMARKLGLSARRPK